MKSTKVLQMDSYDHTELKYNTIREVFAYKAQCPICDFVFPISESREALRLEFTAHVEQCIIFEDNHKAAEAMAWGDDDRHGK